MSLDDGDCRLLRLFLSAVLGDWEELRRIRRSARAGEPDRRWREALLQVHLFAGVPRQVEAAGVLESEGGLGEIEPGEVESSADVGARGAALFDRIYAEDAPPVRAMLARGHPEFERWVLEHAYGRVLARPGLPADRRELLAVVALAALGQERQLASHARGALRSGASARDVEDALAAVADLIEARCAGRLDEARRLIARIG